MVVLSNSRKRAGIRLASGIALSLVGCLGCGGPKPPATATPPPSRVPDVVPSGPKDRAFPVPFAKFDPAQTEAFELPVAQARPGQPVALPASADDVCDALKEGHEALVNETFPTALDSDFVYRLLNDNFQCASGPGGTWAVLLRSIDADEMCDPEWSSCEAKASLVFVGPAGKQQVADFTVNLGAAMHDSPGPLEVTDFDLDGQPEAFLLTIRIRPGQAPLRASYFFRAGDEGIERIVPRGTEGLVVNTMPDEDGDGVPDAQTFGPYEDAIRDPTERLATGPFLLLHATPQGFVSDDEVAKEYALRFCESRPSELDEDSIELSGACSILWGVDEAEVRKQVEAICEAQGDEPFAEECEQGKLVLSWYEHPPFLQLP